MVTVGAVIDRPVVLYNKTTSPQGDNQLFPSEIPIFAMQILGGRSMIAPTTHRNDSSTNRNLTAWCTWQIRDKVTKIFLA